MRSLLDNFVQGSGEAQAVWKLTFSSHHSIDIDRQIYNSESTLYNQLLKLNGGCYIISSAGAKMGKNVLDVAQNFVLTPCIISHFPLISKKYAFF